MNHVTVQYDNVTFSCHVTSHMTWEIRIKINHVIIINSRPINVPVIFLRLMGLIPCHMTSKIILILSRDSKPLLSCHMTWESHVKILNSHVIHMYVMFLRLIGLLGLLPYHVTSKISHVTLKPSLSCHVTPWKWDVTDFYSRHPICFWRELIQLYPLKYKSKYW